MSIYKTVCSLDSLLGLRQRSSEGSSSTANAPSPLTFRLLAHFEKTKLAGPGMMDASVKPISPGFLSILLASQTRVEDYYRGYITRAYGSPRYGEGPQGSDDTDSDDDIDDEEGEPKPPSHVQDETTRFALITTSTDDDDKRESFRSLKYTTTSPHEIEKARLGRKLLFNKEDIIIEIERIRAANLSVGGIPSRAALEKMRKPDLAVECARVRCIHSNGTLPVVPALATNVTGDEWPIVDGVDQTLHWLIQMPASASREVADMPRFRFRSAEPGSAPAANSGRSFNSALEALKSMLPAGDVS